MSGVRPSGLYNFIKESNRIEGIHRSVTRFEFDAHKYLLTLPVLTVLDIEIFVEAIQPGARLRGFPGMDVRVGDHVPPPGGPDIGAALAQLLDAQVNTLADPYETHVAYETLHPFTDGNGRSGRAIWLWMMLKIGRDPFVLERGFLHSWYYQSLSAGRP